MKLQFTEVLTKGITWEYTLHPDHLKMLKMAGIDHVNDPDLAVAYLTREIPQDANEVKDIVIESYYQDEEILHE